MVVPKVEQPQQIANNDESTSYRWHHCECLALLFASLSIDLLFIEQTAHDLGISTSVSTLEINNLPPVSVPAAGVNLLYYFDRSFTSRC
jgi:hypothetical protein